ncbi:MAG: tRNA (adenine-N1)-methyltransferase [Desulfurococcaceae archaeon]
MQETIREGDGVFIYMDEKRKFLIKVQKGRILGTDKGYILHDQLIGQPYGSSVTTSSGHRALVFKPIRPDYTASIRRVTQIIYPKDAAFMIYLSGIGPGSKVGEAGVGTGALTVAIASIIGDEGKLYGFDVSRKAIECALGNLEKAGLLHRVILREQDVKSELNVEPLDSFFLDIPDPWNALSSISRVLKPSATLLIYVPTINQAERTVLALRNTGLFADIHTYELLLREYQVEQGAVRPLSRMIGHTGYIVFARRLSQMPPFNV